ncbi:MAG: hypothetical protein V2B14_03070 [bacterium]
MIDILKILDSFIYDLDSKGSTRKGCSDDFSSGSIFGDSSSPNVAMIDSFDDKTVDIDGDGVADIAHGESTSAMVKSQCPDANIEEYDGVTPDSFNSSCEDIADSINNGKKMDGVNISLAQNMDIDELGEKTGLPLDRDNLSEYKDQIKNKMKNSKDPKLQTAYKEIKSIEKITATGTPVYISAGNEGKDSLNLLNLADGATNVGTDHPYSASNDLVNRYEVGNYESRETYDDNGDPTGYDFTNDYNPDVSMDEVSGGTSKKDPYYVAGTSYSAPTALGEDIAGSQNDDGGGNNGYSPLLIIYC